MVTPKEGVLLKGRNGTETENGNGMKRSSGPFSNTPSLGVTIEN
jgi:hypothetical protein